MRSTIMTYCIITVHITVQGQYILNFADTFYLLAKQQGSVSRDFQPPVFFMIQTHLGP